MTVLSPLFSLAILGLLIFFLFKKKFPWFGLAYLVLLAAQPLVVGLVIVYALPHKTRLGPDIPFLPLAIAAVMMLLGGACMLIRKVSANTGNFRSFLRWLWLVLGVLPLCLGFIFWQVTIWAPQFLKSNNSLPGVGSPVWLIVILITSIVLYLISRQNTQRYPNLMRYVVAVFPLLIVSCNTVFAMTLLYAYPHPPKTSATFWAAMISLGYLPPALLVVGLVRDFILVRSAPSLSAPTGVG